MNPYAVIGNFSPTGRHEGCAADGRSSQYYYGFFFFFCERSVKLQFESWQKCWLIQIIGGSTSESVKQKHILKTTWEFVWEGRRKTEKWGWLSIALDITWIFSRSLCYNLKRLCGWVQSLLLSSFPLFLDTESQLRLLLGFPDESAHFKLKI